MKAILTYHSIDESGSVISTSLDDFTRQLAQLETAGVEVVPLADVVDAEAPAIAITFDDGYVNFAEAAWPRLRKRGWPATVFAVTELLGQTNSWESGPAAGLPLLGASELRDLIREGVAVGCHSARHISLRGVSAETFQRETVQARERLEESLEVPIRSFAYPFGHLHGRLDDTLREAFDQIVTTQFALIESNTSPWDLPRLDAFYFRGNDRLAGLLRPGFANWVRRRRALRAFRSRLRRWRRV